jgi:hypothetical protein
MLRVRRKNVDKTIYFIALFFVAVTLGPAQAHVAELAQQN